MSARPSANSGTPVEIVVGFIARGDRFLVQRRRGDPALTATRPGELWELPGGKVDPGEDHRAALAREVAEETGLRVAPGELVCALCHRYDDRTVALHAYLCTETEAGEPPPGTRWVTLEAGRALAIPAANPPLLDALAWRWARG